MEKIININNYADYIFCPMYYKHKHIDNISLKNTNTKTLDLYENSLKENMYLIFKLLKTNIDENSNIGILNHIKKNWAETWFGNRDVLSFLELYKEKQQKNLFYKKRNLGIKSLINSYNYFADNLGYPIIINKTFKYKMKNNITLETRIDLVREVKTKDSEQIELIMFKVHNDDDNDIVTQYDLELIAASYIFNKLFDIKEDKTGIFIIEKAKFKPTFNIDSKYKTMFDTISNIYKAINNNIFYRMYNKKCITCMYRQICYK